MKYAKSLAYGGELIDALECEHADFKRLVPLCPNCSNPVHLRIGGDRLSAKGTPYKIGPHFAHFAGKSAEEVAACELRVNGYSQADRERIQKIARGQREKWVRRWLWKAFLGFFEKKQYGLTRAIKASYTYSRINEVASSQAVLFGAMKLEKSLHECFDEMRYGEHSFLDGVERQFHLEIVSQIFAYLKTKGARPVLENFCRLVYVLYGQEKIIGRAGLVSGMSIEVATDKYALAFAQILMDLCCVLPWATEFARLEAEEAARVGKKCAA